MAEPSDTPEPEKTPPNKPSKKADAGTVAARIEEVLRLRLNGCEFGEIRQHIAESGWGLQDRQIRTYIERADDLLVERREKNRARLIARHTAQRQDLYKRCLAAGNLKTALAVLDSLAKLTDLFNAELWDEINEMRQKLDALEKPRATSNPPFGVEGVGEAGAGEKCDPSSV